LARLWCGTLKRFRPKGLSLMEWAIYVLATLGGVVALAGACAAFGFLFEAVVEWKQSTHLRSFEEGQQDTRDRLMSDSWWFSECEATMKLIQNLAKGMGADDARSTWRYARTKKCQESEPVNG
jgi:hypothetical protein